jgi:hypothetical protein
MTATAAQWAGVVALCIGLSGTALAQTSPSPGPTVPEKTLPVPKPGESMIINPTREECKDGWRQGMKWSKQEFDKFCAQMEISK